MTREEAEIKIRAVFNNYFYFAGDREADEVIEALRQEPCEDAISRKALLEEIENGIKAGNYEEGYEKYSHINDMDDIIECIKYADSIQPQHQTGHWIVGDGNREVYAMEYECSVCGCNVIGGGDFCKWCGARMFEPQESEDKCEKCEYYINPDYTRCHTCKAESEDKQ